MNATPEATSLARLHDIVVPEPVSWWPLATSWYVLGFVLFIAIAWSTWRAFQRHRRDAYRRMAMAELARLADAGEAERIAPIATLLRRTALSAYARERVVALTGTEWLEFLDATGRTRAFTAGPGRCLADALYDPSVTLPPAAAAELVATAERWIRKHRREAPPPVTAASLGGQTPC